MAQQDLLEEHRQTWRGFVKLITYSAAAVIVTLVLMAIFLL
ncbi:MAG: aa3-type cytochrome c oxidase subunit IV [Alphaproteobacteria bacterium]|nr:MAG: aa3-type cytochrome c oxidase subunit IV [Alphaproteobacteria bacterium]